VSASHPLAARYLDALRAGLGELSPVEREEIVGEIEVHLREALASGRDAEAAIAALGPADRLARAYALEALLNRRPGPRRWLLALAIVAAAGVPSVVVVPVLLAVGLALVFAGLVVWLAGLFAPFAPPHLVIEIDPLAAVTIGPPLAAVGALCLGLLWLYARFLIDVVRRAARPAPGATEQR
jgi:uncharacterized membrane protein